MNVHQHIYADRDNKYELVFYRFFQVFKLICTLCLVFFENAQQIGLIDPLDIDLLAGVKEICLLVILIWQLAEYYALKHGYFKNDLIRYLDQLSGLFLISFFIVYIGIGLWAFSVILFIILMITLAAGTKRGMITAAYSFFAHFATLFSVLIFKNIDKHKMIEHVTAAVYFYMTTLMFVAIFGIIHKENKMNEEKEAYLLKRLEDNCRQLKKSNEKLAGKVAELFTLQQISKAISSILDIKDLLKYVNDIIIGVMGVANSTIILYDQKSEKLNVYATNINNNKELEILNKNINCDAIRKVLKSGQPLIENNLEDEKYAFTKGREIKSMVCMPLSTKASNVGVVLVEHKYADAFSKESVNYLDIISQQVAIAIENARLYHKLQDMAYIDGLTGAYSRDYFNEILKIEFQNARENGYKLSLAIYDVDNFKAFNDTYGHLFGDEILKRIAWTIKAYIRKGDIFARFGGEEFIILFPKTSLDEAYEIAERLRQAVEKIPISDNEVMNSVTLSFGVSCYDDCATNERDLILSADFALYKAKAAGRNCVMKAKLLKTS